MEAAVPRDKSFTIGRSEEADLSIADTKISRIHCVVESNGADWVVEDLDSRNGLWIGKDRVARHVLTDGLTFQLGRSSQVTAHFREAAPVRRVAFTKPSRDPAPAPMPAPEALPPLSGALAGLPGTSLGEFRVIEQVHPLGRAAFFRALQPSLNRHVMLEVFTEAEMAAAGSRQGLQGEVQQAARLLHPNILQIFDYGSSRGFTYVTMEAFQGTNLGRILGARGFVPIGQALALGRILCEALSVAVDAGVPAAVVTPSDIWVDGDFTPKVKFFREPGTPPPTVGDLAYRAPEVLTGGPPTEGSAAVYAVGAILYHMLAAAPPVKGATKEEVARRARHDTPAPLRRANIKVTAMLAKVVEQALAKEPKARQETLRDLSRDLHRTTAPSI